MNTTTTRRPTPKKYYYITKNELGELIPHSSFVPPPPTDEVKQQPAIYGLQRVFTNYFEDKEKSKSLMLILNLKSRSDGMILTSGGSNIWVEYKHKGLTFSFEHGTAMFELEKFDALKEMSKLIDINQTWYVMEYWDYVFVWKLNTGAKFKWVKQWHDVDNSGSGIKEEKDVTYLQYKDAIIVSKENWQRTSYNDYLIYFNKKRGY